MKEYTKQKSKKVISYQKAVGRKQKIKAQYIKVLLLSDYSIDQKRLVGLLFRGV